MYEIINWEQNTLQEFFDYKSHLIQRLLKQANCWNNNIIQLRHEIWSLIRKIRISLGL